jgi:carboxymethylenebutenolidase
MEDLMGRMVDIDSGDGTFSGYLATPAAGVGPAVVVLPEIYNLNAWAREVTDKFARDGYMALAPDLYWRHQPGLALDYTPENQQLGRKLANDLDIGLAVKDIDSCMKYLREKPQCNGMIGLVGYCLGGQLAYHSAVRSSPDGIVSYYGTKLLEYAETATQIRCPAMFHFGEADERVPVATAHEIQRRTSGMKNVEVYVYKDAPHGFARLGYPPHRPEADKLALERTYRLLNGLRRA